MKNFIKGFITATLIITMSVSAFAATPLGNKTISAMLNGTIKVVVNNKQLTMKDAKGNTMLPISYNGSTYLPLRSVAESVGLPVNYDAETSTAFLGSTNKKVMCTSLDNSNSTDRYVWSMAKPELVVDGIQYDSGLVSTDVKYAGNGGWIALNLKKSSTKFGGVLYVSDNALERSYADIGKLIVTIRKFKDDGAVVLGTYYLAPGEVLPFEVDTYGALGIVVEFKTETGNYAKDTSASGGTIKLLEPYYIY